MKRNIFVYALQTQNLMKKKKKTFLEPIITAIAVKMTANNCNVITTISVGICLFKCQFISLN